MNYQDAWDYLDSLQFHKIKLGLDAMHTFMAKVANPEQSLKTVHVAGTNGKGSVSMTLLTILGEAGYRVGLYTSPHLSSVRERFRIGSDFISEEKFAELATRIREVLGDEKITYFEFTTALAFLWFAEEDLDLVVLETGLGGRLDATNVVTPVVSVITNVSMDHEAYLGDTIELVAGEKAGIIKHGVPVVSTVTDGAGLNEVETRCLEKESSLALFGREFGAGIASGGLWQWIANSRFSDSLYKDLRCSMKGDYQVENASLAIAVIELLRRDGFEVGEDDIRQGLASVQWPGRLESFCLGAVSREPSEAPGAIGTLSYLLDGAHNPAGVKSLVETLEKECSYRNLIIIWGAMVDKDLQKTLPQVAAFGKTLILTKPDGERSADPQQLLDNVPEALRDRCVLKDTVEEALAAAEDLATRDDLILIAGSLYLIGAARKILLGELVS